MTVCTNHIRWYYDLELNHMFLHWVSIMRFHRSDKSVDLCSSLDKDQSKLYLEGEAVGVAI